MQDKIVIKGAREHNLKNVSIEIPRDKITVITGLSGSGKSTLAFDTLYAEGQRRYVESLSAYARQFLGIMNKPDVDSIEGLSPAISIDQKTTSRNPRSTVGTVTEIYDYLRLLYARVGVPHCPVCKKEISKQGSDEISANLINSSQLKDKKVEILAPIARGEKGTFERDFERLNKAGLYSLYVDETFYDLSDENVKVKLDKNKKHNIFVKIDAVKINEENKSRLLEAIENALKEGNGTLIVKNGKEEKMFSEKNACPEHGVSLGEIQPRDFSFNSPFGACTECHGLGFKMEFDQALIIPDQSLSILDGAIKCYSSLMEGGWRLQQLRDVAQSENIPINKPIKEIAKEKLDVLLYGSSNDIHFKFESKSSDSKYEYAGKFEGIIPQLERLYHQTDSDRRKEEIGKFMREHTCPKCHGRRLKDEILGITFGKNDIMQICEMSISKARDYLLEENKKLKETNKKIAAPILKEINSRLEFLENVGLNYLTLARESATLSGGESQRIRLATQIGANLTGIIYVLDEPSIGLHQRDNTKLLSTLKRLRDLGNTLVVVEHDEETMREADFVIDMGPGAGRFGGEIVASGKFDDILKEKKSLTGAYLSGKKKIEMNRDKGGRIIRRNPTGKIQIVGASENNLKNLNVEIPLGIFCLITGVSGSGKSSLINEILYPALHNRINESKLNEGKYKSINGINVIDKIITIDQSPIGRTPRSNPATYVGVFTAVRDIFAMTEEAKARGYKAGRFSFNVHEGRCTNCEGDGLIKIEMHFLADVYVPCEVCKGKRYNSQTLEILYKGKNIADILEMSVEEACEFFQNIPSIKNKLETITDVGLGYVKLGQSATTLSGGEAQRVKLATELSKRATDKTLYILDEPTTGLHFEDVKKLLDVLNRLVEKGNSVVVIEHNLDVIKCADYIIDLGPEGGDKGGEIIAQGTPEEVVKQHKKTGSHTGAYLEKTLQE